MKVTNYSMDHRKNLIDYGIAVMLLGVSVANLVVKAVKIGRDQGIEYTVLSLESVDPDTTHEVIDKFNNQDR